ncbi:MAG: hypothetical protein WBQ19_04495 [Terriglobales bacterium]|jgi:hypothetical protein
MADCTPSARFGSLACKIGPAAGIEISAKKENGMKMMKTAVLAAMLTMSAVSQAKPKHLPISNYMREVGLTYLEEVQDLADRCEDPTSKCSAVVDGWKKRMDAIERRADLALDEAHRPPGDTAFFKLLVRTRTEAQIYFTGTIILGKEDLDQHLAGYLNCQRHAKEDMKKGITNAILLSDNTVLETDDECEGGVKRQK